MGIQIHFGPSRPHGHGHHHHHHHHHRTGYRRGNGGSASSSPKTGILLGIIFFVVGIALLFFYNHKVNNPMYDNYISISGNIYDYDERYDYDSGYMYSPIIEYVVGGQKYYINSSAWSSTHPIIGKPVKVKYDPNNPRNAIIESSESGNWIILVVGIVFAVAGALVTVSSVKSLSNGTKKVKKDDDNLEIE